MLWRREGGGGGPGATRNFCGEGSCPRWEEQQSQSPALMGLGWAVCWGGEGFSPAKRGGEPVEGVALVPIRFQLGSEGG